MLSESPRRSSRLVKRVLNYQTNLRQVPGPGTEFFNEAILKLISQDSVCGRLEYSYRLFCSKRHLHYVVNRTGQVLLGVSFLNSSQFFSIFLVIKALVCFIWYYFLRPKIVARVSKRIQKLSPLKNKDLKAEERNLAAMYVAETGFYLKSGRAILGLYLDQDVTKL